MNKEDIIEIAASIGFLTALGAVIYCKWSDGSKQKKYEVETSPLCAQVMRSFDTKPEKDILDSEEGAELAKALGYEGILPTNQAMFQLAPGSYKDQNIKFRMSSAKTSYGGFSAWKEIHSCPKSKLADLVRRPQRR